MTHQGIILLDTSGEGDVHDITDLVVRIVAESGIRQGTAHVFNVGSTACIGTIEYEPGLCSDLGALLARLIPPGRQYNHELAWHDGNAHSHLQASLLGPAVTVPVTDGKLFLGTWQQIFHLECDVKPRRRKIVVTVQGERPA